eukprot:450670_1
MHFDRIYLIYLALAVLSNRWCVATHDSWNDHESKGNYTSTTPRQRNTRSINSEVSLNHPWVGRLTIIETYADGTSWSPLGTAFMFNHPNYMLTVAHVCYGHRSPASTMSVEAYVEFQDGTKISVDWISFYDGFLRDIANSPGHERPKYFRTKNDACMIHLTEPRNVELPQMGTFASQTLQEDDIVYSVGFGEFDQNGSQKCDTQSDLTKPRILQNRIKSISETSIALHTEIKQHGCPGDSGSPLFIQRNGRAVVVGIASGAQFSEPNDRTSTPIRTVFTPISPIKKLMYCVSASDCPMAPSRHLVYTNRSFFEFVTIIGVVITYIQDAHSTQSRRVFQTQKLVHVPAITYASSHRADTLWWDLCVWRVVRIAGCCRLGIVLYNVGQDILGLGRSSVLNHHSAKQTTC